MRNALRAAPKGWSIFVVAVSVALFLGTLPAAASASVSFDFLFSTNHVSDDHQLFLNLAVSNYGFDRPALEPVLPRLRAVNDDLPVVLFLARESGRPVDFIVDLRARGLSWSVVFNRLRVPTDTLFVGIDRDPGPPYGRAWGHWRRNPKRVVLADGDIIGLAQLQVAHRVSGIAPFELARARAAGRPLYVVVADKKGRPFHPGNSGHGGGPPPGHGGGKGHGHGHGHED